MATHYISTTGSNSNTGTIGSPWLTLQYACSQVSTVGDIIHVNAGTYTGSTQCVLAPGVSIEGEGLTSHLISHFNSDEYSFYIDGESDAGSTGNQHISNILLDGDTGYQGYVGICFAGRSNVSIYNCTVKNFYAGAIIIGGSGNYGPPSVYAPGISIHDCSLLDSACADNSGYNLYGILATGGTIDLQCYNNTIYQPNRGANITGECLKMAMGGFVYGTHIYNCSIKTDPLPGSEWSGCGEFFACLGGIEIDHCTIQGTLDFASPLPSEYPPASNGDFSLQDLGDQTRGKYGFALKLHDNQMLYSVYRNSDESEIDIERNAKDGIYIYRNYFSNVLFPIQFSYDNGGGSSTHFTKSDIYIYYNIFYNIGAPGGVVPGSGINVEVGALAGTNDIIQNLNIVNNVFVAGPLAAPDAAITGYFAGSWNNCVIRNNIIEGFPYPLYFPNGGAINTMSVENNTFYNNTHNAPYYDSMSISGKTEQNTLTTDPQFVGGSPYDYHLSSTSSPAYHSGIALSMPVSYTDYAGIAVTNPPERGVYELGGSPVLVTSITVTGAGGATTISVNAGTLQMSAAVLPSNATNKNVTWSVTNGTGSGTISGSGLLTATGNGNVTVTATAQDGSGIYGTLVITISNQSPPPSPSGLNLIIYTNKVLMFNGGYLKV